MEGERAGTFSRGGEEKGMFSKNFLFRGGKGSATAKGGGRKKICWQGEKMICTAKENWLSSQFILYPGLSWKGGGRNGENEGCLWERERNRRIALQREGKKVSRGENKLVRKKGKKNNRSGTGGERGRGGDA